MFNYKQISSMLVGGLILYYLTNRLDAKKNAEEKTVDID